MASILAIYGQICSPVLGLRHRFVCKNGETFQRNADILKLAPLGGSSDWILVWRPPAGNLKRCRIDAPQGSLTLQLGPNNDEPIAASELLDVVVATKFDAS